MPKIGEDRVWANRLDDLAAALRVKAELDGNLALMTEGVTQVLLSHHETDELDLHPAVEHHVENPVDGEAPVKEGDPFSCQGVAAWRESLLVLHLLFGEIGFDPVLDPEKLTDLTEPERRLAKPLGEGLGTEFGAEPFPEMLRGGPPGSDCRNSSA